MTTHYVKPFVTTATLGPVFDSSSYSRAFETGIAQYTNLYSGTSNAATALKNAALPQDLVNETNINPLIFDNLTEGSSLVSNFTKEGQTYSYYPPTVDYTFIADPDAIVQGETNQFSTARFTNFAVNDNTQPLNVYLCAHNAEIPHLLMYTTNTPGDPQIFWTVIAPSVTQTNYPLLSSNTLSGTYYQYHVPLFAIASMSFAVIPYGLDFIANEIARVNFGRTDENSEVYMFSDPSNSDGEYSINITGIPFFSNNTDITQGYSSTLKGTYHVNYQNNSTHILNVCYTRLLSDEFFGSYNFLTASFNFVEDLEAGGTQGLAQGYADYDFNDLCFLLVPQSNINDFTTGFDGPVLAP